MALLTPERAAEELGVTKGTLDNWRETGRGPKYVKLPKAIMYNPADLQVFIDRCTVHPLSTAI